ncbi:hypothetical protein B0H16DRAFT_1568872, partial [Mycena metata]
KSECQWYKRASGSLSVPTRTRSTAVPAHMFSRIAVVVASVLVTIAAATPTGTPPPPITPPTSPQCCESVEPPT